MSNDARRGQPSPGRLSRWGLLTWIIAVVLLLDIGSKTLIVAAHLEDGSVLEWMEQHGMTFAINPKHAISGNYDEYAEYGLEISDENSDKEWTSSLISGRFWDSIGSLGALLFLGLRVKRHDSRFKKIIFFLVLMGIGFAFSLIGLIVNIVPFVPFWLFAFVRDAHFIAQAVWVYNILRNRILILATAMSFAGALGNFSNGLFYLEGVVDFIPVGRYLVNIADFAIFIGYGMIIAWLVFRALTFLIGAANQKQNSAIRWLGTKRLSQDLSTPSGLPRESPTF